MKTIVAAVIFVLAASALPAQEGGLDVRGSVLDSTVLLHNAASGSLAYAGFIRASLSVQNRDRQNAKFDLDASVSLLYGQYADAFLAPVELDVRKLSLTLFLGPVDLTLGRKILNWGYGRVFSPADAYSTADLSDLSLRRRGSDLMMAELYFNEVSGAALILSPTADMSGFKAGAKLFTNLLGFDASLLGVYMNADTDLLLGAALKGSVPPLDIGLTLEGVRHVLRWGEDGWFEAMAGLDYSFFNRALILLVEYYFNERPIDAAVLSPAELLSVHRAFFGRYYAFASAQVGFLDTFSVSASVLTNIETLAAIAALQLTAGIFDNAFVSCSVRVLAGDLNSAPGGEALGLSYGVTCEIRF
jgi:hypothetical protein